MEIDTSSKDNQILRRKTFGEGFPLGFSSFSTLSHRSLEGSLNPFSSFSTPSDDPFHRNKLSTKFAEDNVEAQIMMHGLQPRRLLDLNSESSLQTMDQCQINEPLNLNSCLVFDRKLERRIDLNNKSKKSNIIKGQWTLEEDRLLSELVGKHGVRNWCVIAQKLPRRLGKQCRERWHNHLKPDIKKDKLSEEEDKRLIEAHKELGNRWSQIARRLSGRSENTIKNHWNATKRRLLSRKRDNPNTNTLLQSYIKSVMSSLGCKESLGNSSLPSISSNGTMANSMQREQIEMKSETDARMEVQFDMQKQMDFMGISSSNYNI